MTEKRLIYRFDDIRVEPDELRVCKAGRAVALEPKAFEVLLFLLEHRGRLVEKNELLDAVWSETFVTPNACTRIIAQLRRGLGDDARQARYIETVPTRGYRFIAEVEASPTIPEAIPGNGHSPEEPSAPLSESRRWRRAAVIVVGALALALVPVAALYYWQSSRRAGPASEVEGIASIQKSTQLTSSPSLDLDPAFSPDGNSIAYGSDRGGRFEIYVKPLTPGGREIRVTTDGGDNMQPAWSPDGRQIAFHSRGRGGIWTVPAFGGVARQLTGFGANPAWSPDGEWIIFQSDGGIDIGQAALNAMPPSTIWIVAAQGGAPRQVTRQGEPSGGHGAPAWSVDGRRVFFIASDIMFSEIWSVAPDGGDLRLLFKGQEKGMVYDPAASPDGRYLYFSSGSGNFWIRRLRLDAEGGAAGEAPWLLNTGAVLARQLSFAPDGLRIVYSALTMTNNIGTVEAQTTAAASEPRLLTQDTNYRKTVQMFSPDGRRIAYAVWRMGADGEIWVMDADGGNPQQVTTDPAGLLGWMPDGERLLIFEKRPGDQRLFLIEVGTGVRTELRGPVRLIGGSRLSPDGERLAFNSREGGTINVWTFDLASLAKRQLTFDREMMGFPCWSPDSRMLALEIKRGGDTHIGVMSSEGGPVEQLTSEPGQSWPGSWSPDGQEIAFAGQRRGVWNIYRVSRRDRRIRQLTDYRAPGVYVRYPAWSPRGDQIVYEYAETRGNVWMMTLK